jgi:hypothetical protein
MSQHGNGDVQIQIPSRSTRSTPSIHTLDTNSTSRCPNHAHSQHDPKSKFQPCPKASRWARICTIAHSLPPTKKIELPSALTCILLLAKIKSHLIFIHQQPPSLLISSTPQPSSPPKIQYQASAAPSSPHVSTSGPLPAHPPAP